MTEELSEAEQYAFFMDRLTEKLDATGARLQTELDISEKQAIAWTAEWAGYVKEIFGLSAAGLPIDLIIKFAEGVRQENDAPGE